MSLSDFIMHKRKILKLEKKNAQKCKICSFKVLSGISCKICEMWFHYKCSNSKAEERTVTWKCANCRVDRKDISDEDIEKCNICRDNVADSDRALGCEKHCRRWFHINCLLVPDVVYDYMIEHENISWCCTMCYLRGKNESSDLITNPEIKCKINVEKNSLPLPGDKAKCNICNDSVTDSEKALKCKKHCYRRFHINCLLMPNVVYDYMLDHENIGWCCIECHRRKKIAKSISSLAFKNKCEINAEKKSMPLPGDKKDLINVKNIVTTSKLKEYNTSILKDIIIDKEVMESAEGKEEIHLKEKDKAEMLGKQRNVKASSKSLVKFTYKGSCRKYVNEGGLSIYKDLIRQLDSSELDKKDKLFQINELAILKDRVNEVELEIKKIKNTVNWTELVLEYNGLLLGRDDHEMDDRIYSNLCKRYEKLINKTAHKSDLNKTIEELKLSKLEISISDIEISKENNKRYLTSSPLKINVDKNHRKHEDSKYKNKESNIKIHIVADSNGRSLASLIQKICPKSQITGTIIPGARFGCLLDICNGIKTFTKKDFIIICGGVTDIDKGDTLEFIENYDTLRDLIGKTNIIFMNCLNRYDILKLNTKVFEYNKNLMKLARIYGFSFLYLNHLLNKNEFGEDGLHLKLKGKNKVARLIKLFLFEENDNEKKINWRKKVDKNMKKFSLYNLKNFKDINLHVDKQKATTTPKKQSLLLNEFHNDEIEMSYSQKDNSLDSSREDKSTNYIEEESYSINGSLKDSMEYISCIELSYIELQDFYLCNDTVISAVDSNSDAEVTAGNSQES